MCLPPRVSHRSATTSSKILSTSSYLGLKPGWVPPRHPCLGPPSGWPIQLSCQPSLGQLARGGLTGEFGGVWVGFSLSPFISDMVKGKSNVLEGRQPILVGSRTGDGCCGGGDGGFLRGKEAFLNPAAGEPRSGLVRLTTKLRLSNA